MSETDSTPPDVANALVAQLEGEAELVGGGSFTLDPRKAREKLAAHQLAQPERYVLLLVEAAHLLPNCTGVAFTFDRRATRASFTGVELRGTELQTCFDALFIDVTNLEPERARAIRGRQRLALALNTVLGLPDARVEMFSTIAGEAFVRATFDADARVQLHTESTHLQTSRLMIDVSSAMHRRTQRELLRLHARHATVPVHLDGVRIDGDPAAELLSPVEIRAATGQIVGRAGWCAVQAAQESGRVAFVANGVVVESYRDPELPKGVLALLDADDLPRDLSQAKLQRDESFSQRVAAVATSCEALSRPPPMLGPEPTEVVELLWKVVLFCTGVAIAVHSIDTESIFGILLGAAISVVGFAQGPHSPWSIRHAQRRRSVRVHGEAALGLILSAPSTGTKILGSSELEITMQIERAEHRDYLATFRALIDPKFVHLIEPNKRMYVRIDPNDRNFVVLDAGDAQGAPASRRGESPNRR